MSKALIFGFVLALICLPPLHAQIAHRPPTDPNPALTQAPADSNAAAAQAPAGQAPDDMTNKITDLYHAGKYAEAQQLTTGLLVAYPDDQRLIKAKALLEKLLAPATTATPSSNQPTNNPAPAQPAANANTEALTGMDKVEYNSLIVLARQAQETTDLEQQHALLKQFMDKSGVFLQKYPNEMLLWQLRAASALSLHDADAGYEAGQRLLAGGAADSNNPNLQQLLSKLNLKGWLDKEKVEDYKRYGWILGTWKVILLNSNREQNEVFVKSASGDIEGYVLNADGTKAPRLDMRGTILTSGQIKWELNYWPTFGNGIPAYPSGWQPSISCEISSDKKTMKLLNQSQWKSKRDGENKSRQYPLTHVYTKISDSQRQ